MASPRTYFIIDVDGQPLDGLTPVVQLLEKDGTARALPPMTNNDPGAYTFAVTDDDEAAGCILFVDFGAGAYPRRISDEVYKPDNSNQFWVAHVEDAAGDLWTGVAPTVAAYRWRNGTDRISSAPATVAVPPGSTSLFCWTPASVDVAQGTSIRVNGPPGSRQPYWSSTTKPVTALPTPPPPPGDGQTTAIWQVLAASPHLAAVSMAFGAQNIDAHRGAPAITAWNTTDRWTRGKREQQGYKKQNRSVGTIFAGLRFRIWAVATTGAPAWTPALNADPIDHQKAAEALRNRLLAVVQKHFAGMYEVREMSWLGRDGSALAHQGRSCELEIEFEVPVYEDDDVSSTVVARPSAASVEVHLGDETVVVS